MVPARKGRSAGSPHPKSHEERFRALIEHATDLLAILTVDGRVRYVSPSYTRMMGYGEDELLDRSAVANAHPDDRHQLGAALSALADRDGAVEHIQLRYRHRNGQWRTLEGTATNLLHAPAVRGIVVNVRDVTERVLAERETRLRARQQAAVAQFGQRALAGRALEALLADAVSVLATTLQVEYAKVLELMPDGEALLLRAGIGWHAGLVGRVSVPASIDSQAAYTLQAGSPVIVDDLRTETRFHGPALLLDHHVVSGVSVIIHGPERPFGVLGVHTTAARAFSADDVNFVQAMANVLGSIIERARADERLAFQARTLALVSDAVIRVDPDSMTLGWNSAAERLYGWSAADVLGRHPEDFLHSEFHDVTPADILRHLAENGSFRGEATQSRRDGSRFPAEISITLLRDVGGEPAGYISVSRDITARIRDEIERARLSAAIEQAGEAIVITDPDGSIVYVNPAFCHLAGYARHEVLGASPAILKSGRHDAAFFRQMWETIGRGQVWSGNIVNRRKDSSLYESEVVISPVRDAAGQIVNYVELARDVTHERQLEGELRQLNADLERRVADRTRQLEIANRELEAFCYSVSHDLRAPLRGIHGFSHALREDCAAQLDAQGCHYLQRISTAAEHMGELIEALLNLSRVSRAELSWSRVDLSALARTVAEGLQRAEPARQVELVIADDLAVEGDLGLLRVMLDNLLGNAWKYTRRRARARIELGMHEADGARVYFVRDDGAGFDMAYVDKLFGAFQRLHDARDFEGTGIGLATVQRIIARHGGHAWAAGAVGQGATISFTLGAPPA